MKRLLRRALLVLLWTFLLLCIAAFYLRRDPAPAFEERRGRLARTTAAGVTTDGAYEVREVRLVSTSGMEVEVSIKQLAAEAREPRPVVVLLGGHRTGRDSVHLVRDPGEAIIVGMSYPFHGNHRAKGLELLVSVPAMRRGIADTVPALLLTLDYVLANEACDPERVELVGVSLGAPFACMAGALDERYRRVWSVHGGANLGLMLEHSLKRKLSSAAARQAAVFLIETLTFGEHIAPEAWAPRIAPRELVLLNALEDERIPRPCVEQLYEAARDPKELVWLPGGHVDKAEEEVVADLVGRVLDRVFD